MSESSEHILDNDLDKTSEFTDDEDGENFEVKNSRGNNKDYEPVCSFRSVEQAKKILKEGFFDSKWTQLNTYNNTTWFKCKLCEKRLKIVTFENHCVVHIEDTDKNNLSDVYSVLFSLNTLFFFNL